MMRWLAFSLVILAVPLQAQLVETTFNGKKVQGTVIDGDTIPWVFLDEILVMDKPTFTDVEARKRYLLLRRRVLKVYPYAKAAGERLDSLNMRLAKEKSARKRVKYTKQYQKFLEERFEAELRKLTRSEGQILCKLVYRETDQTVFKLIRQYRNWLTAVGWSVTGSWYDINIRKYEYGKESLWKRKDQSKTTKRLSFVYTCDTTEERSSKQGLIKAVQFFFKTMKKREINPVGPLVVEFLKEHASSLYDYLLRKKPNEEMIAEDITDDIDKHFRAGFVLHWDDCLNHWMVDYDIIRVLKRYVGYSSWTDVPTKQRGLCYKNYNQNVTLPEWDIEQERY